MATQYQVNLQIGAGTYFSQDFYITHPDMSPQDITGCKFTGVLSKHAQSINATKSTSEQMVYKYYPFTMRVSDGVNGIINMTMSAADTTKLSEGKYVYNVNMIDVDGYTTNCLHGLVFVVPAFGSVFDKGVIDSDDLDIPNNFY